MPIPQEQREGALRELNARADALQQRTAPQQTLPHGAAVNQAYKIIAELFGGVLIGLALGYGVDRLTGTTEPWGLIGGVLVGFALSVFLARRTANRLMAQAAAEQADAQAGVTPSAPPRDGEKD